MSLWHIAITLALVALACWTVTATRWVREVTSWVKAATASSGTLTEQMVELRGRIAALEDRRS